MDAHVPPRNEEYSARNSTDVPSHGTVPKWLEEISEKVVRNHIADKNRRAFDVRSFFEAKETSARFGRRSSFTPTHHDSYLVPRLDSKFDPHQLDLEKSWKSLDHFKQSHKGRLDSAKDFEASDNEAGDDVPSRSRSEMSDYANFERKLHDYRSQIDKENQLREEIISELLAENERISERLKRHHSKHKVAPNEHVFIIPTLPTGQRLIVDILSTWGDKHYVGLNGIEIFGVDGKLVKTKRITAIPQDVNVLPECDNDPRVVSNLLDEVNRTQDDMHIWLAPFEMGCSHIITVDFEQKATLSMIRIWNYNKSRIHSYRGVRDVVMFLDDTPIFKGEIAKACGGILGGIHAFGDTILFTTDGEILERISKNDTSYSFLTSGPNSPTILERPPTSAMTSDARPVTGIPLTKSPNDQILLGANRVDFVLLSNWGHSGMIGLTGIELIEADDAEIAIEPKHLSCSVTSEGVYLARLISGVNVTNEAAHMWWTSFNFGEEVTISVLFDRFKYVSGVRVWNYNASLETSYAGVRATKILLDGKPVTNPLTRNEIFILRRAPGNRHYDFVQDVRFADNEPSLLDQNEFYEPSSMPEGFVFQIVVFSSWGDQYYCGLNGLELYNQYGKRIVLDEQNVCAYPESVNSLQDVVGDVRTPNKLVDGVNDDHSGSHSWLAPIVSKHLNRIYVVMDRPIVVSLVKLWNYSKTPSRGIKEFGILVDDLLVYNGTLEKYSNGSDGYQSVLFTDNESILGEEYDSVLRNTASSQDVVLMDQDIRSTTRGSLPDADPALRPFTSVNLFNRGFTSFSH